MAKRIIKDVSDCTLDKTKYSTRLITEKLQQFVSDALMRLLVPTSMFSETGEMRITKEKSTLKNVLKKDVSYRYLVKQVLTVITDDCHSLYNSLASKRNDC